MCVCMCVCVCVCALRFVMSRWWRQVTRFHPVRVWHGEDRAGNQVYIERTGLINSRGLAAAVSDDQHVQWYTCARDVCW